MIFNQHSKLEGLHAPFSPSQPSWLRYDDAKVLDVYANKKANEMGTILHSWVKSTIDLGIKQPRSNKTLYSYVNDAIGFKMSTEVVLFYSERFFGTADAISFRKEPRSNGRYVLRIHDLKTGKVPAKIEQLRIYAALFCLEYDIKPGDIDMELRIYQNDDIQYDFPTAEDILPIMDIIVHFNKLITRADSKEV